MKLKLARATFINGKPHKAGAVVEVDEPTARTLKGYGYVDESPEAPEPKKDK